MFSGLLVILSLLLIYKLKPQLKYVIYKENKRETERLIFEMKRLKKIKYRERLSSVYSYS